ncbi:MAG TPA: hypothetical protein VK809_03120 [Bacteroidia bacterium]|jgi:hypothetical protein|nr:hypothetical protein [Bacteroidia bacterium]
MKTNKFLTAASIVALGFISTSVFAQSAAPAAAPAPASNFDKTHPRRAQVNSRLQNQNARTDNKVADGKMSKAEGAKIHAQDHAIRKEEKRDAAANGGHITKAEQKHINHQENHVSREIKNH